MTKIAKLILSESDATALAANLAEDETLSALPLGTSEAAEDRWHLTVYLSEGNEKAELAALRAAAKRLLGRVVAPGVETLPETDWVAKSLEGLQPVRAGRFLVHGSHDRSRRRSNDVAIEIEAGEAFGTGHHGTTAGCLIAIDRALATRPIRNALDVGTGSGVLAIAIAKAAKVGVLATDIDPVAVRVARGNIRLNGAAGYVTAIEAGTLEGRAFEISGPFDLVVANILAGPLMKLAPAIRRRTAPGGTVILSGLLPDQRARIVAAYRGSGFMFRRSAVLDGWLTLVFAG